MGRPDKPLAQPGAPVRLAWGMAVALLLAAIAGTLPLGWGAASVAAFAAPPGDSLMPLHRSPRQSSPAQFRHSAEAIHALNW